MRVLALVTDAFGGHGGIAHYNRNLLTAIASYPPCSEVIALARMPVAGPVCVPPRVTYRTHPVLTRVRYAIQSAAVGLTRPFDLIVCGHVQLLPVAFAARAWRTTPVLLTTHGIEVWKPRSPLHTALMRRCTRIATVSAVTAKRMIEWARLDATQVCSLPNAISLAAFAAGPKPPGLLARYGLEGRTVLLTVGRMDASERAKGFDEVLECLPAIARRVPDVSYVAVGDGTDRARLQAKARALGVAGRVLFTGSIDESEKADHYRLADAYVMPSRGEGFGIVFLEALACGIPVVASRLDGGVEATRSGKWGELCDPNDPGDIVRCVLAALERPRGFVPEGLTDYDVASFERRTHELVGALLRTEPT